MKKVGKTTRPFRYDLDQIPYGYTVEVRNRFKGLDLIISQDEGMTESPVETLENAIALHLFWTEGLTSF